MNPDGDRSPPLWLSLLHRLPPELAHALALWGVRMHPRVRRPRSERLHTRIGPIPLPHPVGLAAGLDKDAVAVDGLLRLGFSFVEVGSVTLRPQPGNPPPRLFRLPEDKALINRIGFASAGAKRVAARLRRRREPGVVGVNIGINRDCRDPAADYAAAFRILAPLADYVTVNLSSPNTPGLRELQRPERLAPILERLLAERERVAPGRPLFLKLAPDLEPGELAAVVDLARAHRLTGLVLTNTTTARPPELRSPARHQSGGLSGRPLWPASTRILAEARARAGEELALIGCGGIFDAEDAYRKIRSGAWAVQLLTGLVFKGPGIVVEILEGLLQCLERDGFASLAQARERATV